MFWTEKLLAWSLLLQSVELFGMRLYYSEEGIWRWSTLRREYGASQKLFHLLFRVPHFYFLLFFQFIFSILLLVSPSSWLFLFLFILVLLTSVRWRGTLNGGSDSLLLLSLLALFLVECFGQRSILGKAAIYFVCVQVSLSYFIAGISKALHPSWRKGRALSEHAQVSLFEVPPFAKKQFNKHWLGLLLCWSVLVFEVSFPLVWFFPKLLPIYLLAGGVFHLGNVYLFGLNRFFWVWIATYPLLYETVTHFR